MSATASILPETLRKYDLNAERPLPRIIEIDPEVLPDDWPRFCTKNRIRVHAVLGYENEVENQKIWPASNIVFRGIERGEHLRTDTIIDSTSGNYGAALVSVVRQLHEIDQDFPIRHIVAVVPRNLPPRKRAWLEGMGIKLRDADNSLDAMDLAKRLAAENGWWYTKQYWNTDNGDAYGPIACHIAEEIPDLGVFACGVGSGGSCSGIMPELAHAFSLRAFQVHRVAVMVEKGQSVDGVRTEEAAEPGSLDWRMPTEDVRFIAELPSLKFSAALWRQAWKTPTAACLGGPSTGFVGEGLMLALNNLSARHRLDGLRGKDDFVHASFIAPDTRKPYRDKYERHGFYLRDEEWELPRFVL